jgi:hypothetical protein
MFSGIGTVGFDKGQKQQMQAGMYYAVDYEKDCYVKRCWFDQIK